MQLETKLSILGPVVLNDNFGMYSIAENCANYDQFIETNIADKTRQEVDNDVTAVKNRIYDAILTAMDNVVIPRAEMAARSLTESSGRGPNGIVQNTAQRDFSGNTENTPLMSASS